MRSISPRTVLVPLVALVLLSSCGDSETTTVTQTVTDPAATTSSTESTTTTEDVVADCDEVSQNIGQISVRNISCEDALDLLTNDIGQISKNFGLGGFQCARIEGGRFSGVWRCTDGDQAIRFSFGD